MSNPTSFRFPFNLAGKVHPEVESAIRYAFSGLKDVNDAIPALKSKVDANASSITTINNILPQATAGASVAPAAPFAAGNVNLQPNPPGTTYTTQSSDFGGLVVVQSAAPFAYSLNSGLRSPYYTLVYNVGPGTVTLTPTTGTVNNLPLVTVLPGQLASVYLDSTRNWWAVAPTLPNVFTRGGTIVTPIAPVNIIVWRAPFAATVTNVLGYTSGTTGSVINARRNGSLSLLVGDLTLNSADVWIDGGAVQNTAFSVGDKLEIMLISVAGSPTEIAVEVQCTRP